MGEVYEMNEKGGGRKLGFGRGGITIVPRLEEVKIIGFKESSMSVSDPQTSRSWEKMSKGKHFAYIRNTEETKVI